nr:zinc finger, CCHC-type [Tanacetum cinerariifolium]
MNTRALVAECNSIEWYSSKVVGKGVIICLYVDDMLIFGTDQVQVDLTKEFFSSRFSMKDTGEAYVILGIRIKHESNGITISQSHYIEKVMKKFNYSNCTPVSTSLDTCEKLMPNRGILVIVELSIVLEGYTDASWISNTEDNSSTSGWVFLLGGALIFIRCDSAATLAKAYSQMYNRKSRHLGVRHSMIRELIMNEVRDEARVLQIIPRMCLEPAVRRMKLLTSQWDLFIPVSEDGDTECTPREVAGNIIKGLMASALLNHQRMDLCKVTTDNDDSGFESVHIPDDDDSTLNNMPTTQLLETFIKDVINKKETLDATIYKVTRLMIEVEREEKAAEEAKEEAIKSGFD